MALRYSSLKTYGLVYSRAVIRKVETRQEALKLPFVALYHVPKTGIMLLEALMFLEKKLDLNETQ